VNDRQRELIRRVEEIAEQLRKDKTATAKWERILNELRPAANRSYALSKKGDSSGS
jgi:hypothetical protein